MVRARLDADELYGLRLTLFAVAFMVAAVPFGWLLDEVDDGGWLVRQDATAADQLHREVLEHAGWLRLLRVVTTFGAPPLLMAAAVAGGGLLLWQRRLRLATFVALTVPLGALVDVVVKRLVARPRPALVEPVATAMGYSFPSGHAMNATVAYGVLLVVLLPVVRRRWQAVLGAGYGTIVGAIAFTRLALGVHYLSDVVGGVLLGLAWLLAATAAFATWRVDRNRAETGRRPRRITGEVTGS